MKSTNTETILKNFNQSNQDGKTDNDPLSSRCWFQKQNAAKAPVSASSGRKIGRYPLTSEVAGWAKSAMAKYQPNGHVLMLVEPFCQQFHNVVNSERKQSSGLHDLDEVELTYQLTLEIFAEVLLAADNTKDPVIPEFGYHSSQAGADEHFLPWGRLLCSLETDPPIIAMFPIYLMMCQAFSFTKNPLREDYVYSLLTGVDWARGENKFSERLEAFEKVVRSSVTNLEGHLTGNDRSFWRISQAYVRAMNDCETSRELKTPRIAAIEHSLDHDLIIAARAFDTIGSAYQANDGAAWLDDQGMDSLIGSGLSNDVMDLHTDVKTQETRNLLRLLYPSGLTMAEAKQTVSTILGGQLCELFRGHRRARFNGREDGRISASSPSYSFCRARHRKIFEVMEAYTTKYPEFWEWTWEIWALAKAQVTDAGMKELLVGALHRSVKRGQLPPSERSKFYDLYYDMVECNEGGDRQLAKKNPLGVTEEVSEVVRKMHSLYHEKLTAEGKKPGWGREFDRLSDELFGEAGELLAEKKSGSDDLFKFCVAYGRLATSLPYVAYHTVAAIILVHGTAN